MATTVTTDGTAYAPGSTATIDATGFDPYSTIEFTVQTDNAGPDGILGTADDTLGSPYSWFATGGADGALATYFYLNPAYAGATLQITASEVQVGSDGAVTPV